MTQELLTASELQSLFDLDRSTIYRMAGDGRLPAVKIGRQWRFPADAIRRLVTPTEEPRPTATTTTLAGESATRVVEMVAEALGVMMVITDLDGHPISPVMNPCSRFLALQDDPEAVIRCAQEWREMATAPDPHPQFRPGAFGFLCARSFIRFGGHPEAMVLAGGVAPEGDASDDLFVLSDEQRRRVVSTLPRVAAILARLDQRSIA
jgi:excisionase family DNA binding protein